MDSSLVGRVSKKVSVSVTAPTERKVTMSVKRVVMRPR